MRLPTASLFLLSFPLLSLCADPPSIPPYLNSAGFPWPTLDTATPPTSYLYQCHTGAPGFAPTTYNARQAAAQILSLDDADCTPLPTPGCRTLGTYENAKISYCWDDGPHGPGGTPSSGWCATVEDFVQVFINRCLRRALSGGFVKVVESEGGLWVNSTVVVFRDPDVPPSY